MWFSVVLGILYSRLKYKIQGIWLFYCTSLHFDTGIRYQTFWTITIIFFNVDFSREKFKVSQFWKWYFLEWFFSSFKIGTWNAHDNVDLKWPHSIPRMILYWTHWNRKEIVVKCQQLLIYWYWPVLLHEFLDFPIIGKFKVIIIAA